jgi:hypothetical protein
MERASGDEKLIAPNLRLFLEQLDAAHCLPRRVWVLASR